MTVIDFPNQNSRSNNSNSYDGNLAYDNNPDYTGEMNKRPEYRNQNQEDNQQAQAQEDENLTNAGKIQKARLLNRRLNQLKTKVSEVEKKVEDGGRILSYGLYKATGDPEIVGYTFGLSILAWWPIHFIGKYIGSFRIFPKFVSLSVPDTINIKEIIKNKEKSSIVPFVVLGVDAFLWFVVGCIATVLILLIVRAGKLAEIWRIFTDPIGYLSDFNFIANLIKDLL
ncbi:MAG: hypothetical protein PHZ07_04190 [Patescibacteria group bacterium]|nr:hypothetical protein [Patescibacteria group bacterium]MDD4304772.1 hypothetical protein [Patescibacteria group bacterium]MDD4695489.1 hypothetical protein [Patescibacteria group bacterium]